MTTTQQATSWWANHAIDPAWVAHYAASETQPHRGDVIASLSRLGEWESLFEVGCHCGPMLHAVRMAFPVSRLAGCDVNREAVDAARTWLPSVMSGAFPAVTEGWPAQCVDVVLSCYALAYLSPEDIGAALDEAGRLARRAVVLCEPVAWDGLTETRGEGAFIEWRHPYLSLLRRETFFGWTATCQALRYDANQLSGLIVVERP
jgi:hypothetical protein